MANNSHEDDGKRVGQPTERKNGLVNLDKTVNYGALMQVGTVVVMALIFIINGSNNASRAREDIADLKAQFKEDLGSIKTAFATSLGELKAAQIEGIGTLKTELSGQIKETSTKLEAVQSTLDQKLPLYDAQFQQVFARFEKLETGLSGLKETQDKFGLSIFSLEQWRATIDKASREPTSSQRGTNR